MAKAHFLAQLNFHTQLSIPCQTLLVSYAPTHFVYHEIANNIQELESIMQLHAAKSQCIILCSEQQKYKLKNQIQQYLHNIITQNKEEAGHSNQDDQLIAGLSESEGDVREALDSKLRQIVERTEKKMRQSKIKLKICKIDSEIKKIQELQSTPQIKRAIESSTTQGQRDLFKVSKKEKKKQKGMRKKLQQLRDKKSILEHTKHGTSNSSALLELLQQKSSSSEESSDSILI